MEQRQRFTAEFKREAVRQLKESGKPVATLARELGVARNKLYAWADLEKKHGAGAFPGSGRKPDDELAKLKPELERVKEENEILSANGVRVTFSGSLLGISHSDPVSSR